MSNLVIRYITPYAGDLIYEPVSDRIYTVDGMTKDKIMVIVKWQGSHGYGFLPLLYVKKNSKRATTVQSAKWIYEERLRS